MRARFVVVLMATAALGFTLPLGGCGDNDNSGAPHFEVDVDGERRSGSTCPLGTTEAYREGSLIVCNGCAIDPDCGEGRRCSIQCGPGCEDDTSGCCPVRRCAPF